MFRTGFDKRAHPFNSAAALAYAKITVAQPAMGKQTSETDCPIAAIGRPRGTVVKRNMRDYADAGIE